MRVPQAFAETMKDLLGRDYAAYEASFAQRSSRGLRVNTRKIAAEDLAKLAPFSLTRIPWTPNGYYLGEEDEASRHPYYAAGLYYLQEPSAMAPAACLPVQPGDRVLDLCAAPGGKATELAARLQGEGILVANDVSHSRAKALLRNLELFGAENILVTSEEPEQLSSYFPGWFDRILVDAPCSGEGMFRKEPSMSRDWEERGPAYYAPLQRRILHEAVRMLRPGGYLLYSTCTFSPLEDEENLLYLLREEGMEVCDLPFADQREEMGIEQGRPDVIAGELTADEQESIRRAARFYPHRLRGEGHFVALLKKTDNSQNQEPERTNSDIDRTNQLRQGKKSRRQKPNGGFEGGPSARPPEEWTTFSGYLRRNLSPERIEIHEDHLYYLPEALEGRSLRGLRFLRTGLYLGELKKNRFEPSQALAMILRPEEFGFILNLPAEDPRVVRYLKGETIEAEETEAGMTRSADCGGWILICADGHPLGFGKWNRGSIKNKLYPGWRWMA